MVSVTLEVKINNQSCKQGKRRGRSWGKQVTKEKHIGASKVKQKRVTGESRQKSSWKEQITHCLLGQPTGKEPRGTFLPAPSWQDQLEIFFLILYFGATNPFPTCTHHLLLVLHSFVRMAEQRWIGAGEGHTTALEHPQQAMLECLPYQAVPRGANGSSPLRKSGLGAAKLSQLTDLPRFKLRSFNQEILQDSTTGEISKHLVNPGQVSSCVSLIQKKSFPPPKIVAEGNNFAFKCFCFLS